MEKGPYLSPSDYIDVIIRDSNLLEPALSGLSDYVITKLDDTFSILSVKNMGFEIGYEYLGYPAVPDLYFLEDYEAARMSGALALRNRQGLGLSGLGTLIGIIDTGINYEHEAFLSADGNSRIRYF